MRQITDAALDLIKRDEGLRLTAYQDPVGVLTIGYGHTGTGIRPGQQITEAEAELLLRGDLRSAQVAVDAVTHDVATTDAQFSAMVSLAFNIGTAAFKGSSVLRKHRAGDYPGAGAAFLMWDKGHVNGQLVVIPGLLRRRNEERLLYLDRAVAPQKPADPQPPAPMPSLFSRILSMIGWRA